MKKQYEVEGMTCTACALAIERQLGKVDGVTRVNVNYANEKMVVEYNEELVNEGLLSNQVEDIGYKLITKEIVNQSGKSKVEEHQDHMRFRLFFSLVFTIPLFYIAMGPMVGIYVPSFFQNHNNALMIGLIQLLITIPVMIVNSEYYKVGFKTLYKRSPNMDSLIAVGTTAAFIYGIFVIFQLAYGFSYQDNARIMEYRHDLYFESVAVILTLITLGKYFEARAKGKTLKAMEALMELAPDMGLVLKDKKEILTPVEEIYHGDILLIKAGDKVPLDGKIIEGNLLLDESMLTGESVPLDKTIEDVIFAGTYCKTGYGKIEVTKTREETALFNIVKLVEEAQSTKAPIAKLADRISGYFVPVVLIISALTFIVWMLLGEGLSFAFQMAVSVLVISCPCALGLATPTAIMVGTGKGAQYGTLIKSGEALEQLHQIDTIVFDKTGTLTKGKPILTEVIPFEGFNHNELIAYVTSVEKLSEHPYAKAIVDYFDTQISQLNDLNSISYGDFVGSATIQNYETIPGKGVKGTIKGSINGKDIEDVIRVGNKAMVYEGIKNFDKFEEQSKDFTAKGKTPLLISINNVFAGFVVVEDTVKEEAKDVVASLKAMKIKVVMLTGDHQSTAQAIANDLDIDHVYSEVLPGGKADVITELMKDQHKVAMVGDGINDAVALTTAHVGIAIGTGTDVAIESADVVLVKDALKDVITAIELSKATIRNIKQNLFWAFFYNIVGIPIAAGLFYYGLGIKLNPMFAAAAMSFSSVSVVTNALRLRGFKPSKLKASVNKAEPVLEIATNINTKADITNETNTIKEAKAINETSITKEVNNKTINVNDERNGNMKKLMIDGMSCMHCVGRVDKALKGVEGIKDVNVDLESNSATVSFDGSIADDVLVKAVVDAGYEVTGVEEV